MNCMRCGRETAPGQVFCEECRSVMDKYPVNPDTPVHLPRQRENSVHKKPVKKKTVSYDEQIRTLKKQLRFFVIWSLISTALALALAYPAFQYLMEDHFKPGQNYTAITPTETAETTPA